MKKDEPEYYPPALVYRNITENGGRPRITYHTESGLTKIVQSVFRINSNVVAEVAMQITPYTSFCGGMWAHSPDVQLRRDDDDWFPSPAPRGSYAEKARLSTNVLVDIRDHGVKLSNNSQYIRYCYRVLANAVLSYCTHRGKRGLITCGPTDGDSPIVKFNAQAKKITHLRPVLRIETGDGSCLDATVVQDRPLLAGSVIETKVHVDKCAAFINPSSGNAVRWYPMTITNAPLGWDGDSEGRHNRDTSNRLDYLRRNLPRTMIARIPEGINSLRHTGIMTVVPTVEDTFIFLAADEQEYLAHAACFARQHSWCFG